MKVRLIGQLFFFALLTVLSLSFEGKDDRNAYEQLYLDQLHLFENSQIALEGFIQNRKDYSHDDLITIQSKIKKARIQLKGLDFWLRYLEPITYKKVNGPLPVEWETEVFEKFEKPYKREAAGFTLATQLIEEDNFDNNELYNLIKSSREATQLYGNDSISNQLKSYDHFFLCNRLFLLNLASIYTTGFDCPNPEWVIPELKNMLVSVQQIYQAYQVSFPNHQIDATYINLYKDMNQFVGNQPTDYRLFDHYAFLRDYVNPLFVMNQKMIQQYKVVSKNMIDYSLNKKATSLFAKNLYVAQNPKGVFLRVNDEAVLNEIAALGKLLYYDPILSANNQRSCFSCHNPQMAFTDTTKQTAIDFEQKAFLPRNAPSLLNVQYNHLLMLDGKHITLQAQCKAVITSPAEMGSNEQEMIQKVMSCKEYASRLKPLLKYTPQEKEVNVNHIASAITLYYSKFSQYSAPFDDAMNKQSTLNSLTQQGFNLFMGKAQCATCHFVPQFNGVKPPYTGSEFEVIGVPNDTNFKQLSQDKGRYLVHPATETLNAFRTGSLRNIQHTKPYMHNGIYNTLEQVVDFYNAGGGAGRGLTISNQTLSSDSLGLTNTEKEALIAFMQSLTEKVVLDETPNQLPKSANAMLNNRKVGGVY